MKRAMDAIAGSGIVPVVVLEKVEDAVPTANALLAGGINVMEITFRTAAAADSIKVIVAWHFHASKYTLLSVPTFPAHVSRIVRLTASPVGLALNIL